MWLIDRLWPARSGTPMPPPLPLPAPEALPRLAPLKRPLRVGRGRMAPWQKVSVAPRRRGH